MCSERRMTCDNNDSDANVFAQNCIIFVHCAMFCLEFISVCMYVCMRASCMFILHASSACILHAVHSHSCICLLRSVAYSLGVIAYILLYMRSLPSSSTVMYLVRLSYECHAEVNFSFSSYVVVSLVLSSCRVLVYLLIVLVLCSFCA